RSGPLLRAVILTSLMGTSGRVGSKRIEAAGSLTRPEPPEAVGYDLAPAAFLLARPPRFRAAARALRMPATPATDPAPRSFLGRWRRPLIFLLLAAALVVTWRLVAGLSWRDLGRKVAGANWLLLGGAAACLI